MLKPEQELKESDLGELKRSGENGHGTTLEDKMWDRLDPTKEEKEETRVTKRVRFGDGDYIDIGFKLPESENIRPMGQTPEESEVRISQPKRVTTISKTDKQRIADLIESYYEKIFQEELTGDTASNAEDFKIIIKNGERLPKPEKMRRRSRKEEEILSKWLKTLLKAGFIEKAHNVSHAAQPVIVYRNGKERVCIDFRRLNEVTVVDVFPQKSMDQILSGFCGKKIFSTMDATSGFNQVKISVESRNLTAFKCMFGCYRMVRMPFGLVNAPAHFNRWLDTVFHGLEVMRYVDDLVVASKTVDQHIAQLTSVFERCAASGVKLKMSKCLFGVEECKVLGFIVSADGIRADPDKVKAIKEFGAPRNKKEMQTFLGMVGFYRRFYRMLAADTTHLRRMTTAKGKGYEWTEEAKEEFQRVKDELARETLLFHPDPTRPFFVHCDASKYAIGAVLLQEKDGKLKIVEFFSRKLTKHEINYAITEKEGLALVASVERWHHYLHGAEFDVLTDHQPLLKWSKMEQGRLRRWKLRLSPYAFKIRWKKGDEHIVPDAISRDPALVAFRISAEEITLATDAEALEPSGRWRVGSNEGELRKAGEQHQYLWLEEELATKMGGAQLYTRKSSANRGSETSNTDWEILDETQQGMEADIMLLAESQSEKAEQSDSESDFTEVQRMMQGEMDDMAQAQAEDEECAEIVEALKGGEDINGLHQYKLEEGVLMKETGEGWKVWVPTAMRTLVMYLNHNHIMAGHRGIVNTGKNIARMFYWPNMRKDISLWCKACRCQRAKLKVRPKRGLSGTFKTFELYDAIHIDHCEMERSKEGYLWMLSIVDRASREVELVPTRNKSAVEGAKAIFKYWIARRGPPLVIYCDQDAAYQSNLMSELGRIMGTRMCFFSPYTHHNGLAEACNKTACQIIRSMVACKQIKEEQWQKSYSLLPM